MLCFMLWGRTLRIEASDFSSRSTFIGRAKGKGGVFLEKVFVSAGQGIKLKARKCLTVLE